MKSPNGKIAKRRIKIAAKRRARKFRAEHEQHRLAHIEQQRVEAGMLGMAEFLQRMEDAMIAIEAGHTIRLTGMSDEDFMALLVEANDRARDGDRP